MADRTAEPLSNRIGLSLRANFLPRRQPLHFVSAVHALVGPDLGTVALKGVRYAAGKEGDATLIFVGANHLAGFRIDQMRTGACRTDHGPEAVICGRIVSDPALNVQAGVGAAIEEGSHCSQIRPRWPSDVEVDQ